MTVSHSSQPVLQSREKNSTVCCVTKVGSWHFGVSIVSIYGGYNPMINGGTFTFFLPLDYYSCGKACPSITVVHINELPCNE